MAENDETPKSTADVTSDSKTPADPTSKPVISGHHFLAKDPMVSGGDNLKPSDPEIGTGKEEKQPLKEPKPELKLEPASSDAIEPEDKPKTPEPGNGPAPKKPASDKAKFKNEPSEQDIARANAIKQLADSKRYYLPINNVASSRAGSKLAVVFIVLLVAGLVAVYLMK